MNALFLAALPLAAGLGGVGAGLASYGGRGHCCNYQLKKKNWVRAAALLRE
jgi:hypothetical protein